MLPLARAAVRAGHDVLISSGADISGLIERRGFRAHQAGPTLQEAYAAAGAAMAELGGLSEMQAMTPTDQLTNAARHFFGAAAVTRAGDLGTLLADWRPGLIVHDNMELGAPAAAEIAGIPHVTHSYGPIVPGTEFFAELAGQTLATGGLPDPIESIMAGPYLDICPPSLQPTGDSAPWTQPFALAPSAGEVDKADELPVGFTDLPHPETIYLTLGTIMNQQPEVFRAVLQGCTRLEVNVLTTVGPGVDPADLGPQPAGVLITDYVSQALVLPHCTAVASHVGAGTMLGALCFGLPQLALPQGTDQPHNSVALVATGSAVALQPDEITADAVAASLDRVLRDPAIRAAAEGIRTEIGAMPPADAVLDQVLSTIAG